MDVDDLILISVDDHLIEPPDLFVHHLDAKYLDRAPKLVRNEQGRLVSTGQSYLHIDDVGHSCVRKIHSQDLELSRKSLESDSASIRDFASLTIAIDPKRLLEARRVIRDFRDRFSSSFEVGERSEVYKLSIQLFPLSRVPSGS